MVFYCENYDCNIGLMFWYFLYSNSKELLIVWLRNYSLSFFESLWDFICCIMGVWENVW